MTTTGAEQAASSVLMFLVESSARAAAFAAAAGLAMAALRGRRAALRLCLWTIVLYAAMAMPVLDRALPAFALPRIGGQALSLARLGGNALSLARFGGDVLMPHRSGQAAIPAAQLTDASARRVDAAPNAAIASYAASPQGQTTPAGVSPAVSSEAPGPSSGGPPAVPLEPAVAAVIVYLLGVACLLLRAAVGWMVTRRLERSARPVEDAEGLARLGRHAAAAGVRPAPLLTESDRLLVPVTTSVRHPMIVLPARWREWPEAKIDAVLAHEMAHIARRDTLTQRISLIYRAIFWPNPFSWWLHRRLAVLAEQVSDEAALNAGVDRAVYAETLVGFFAERRDAGRRAIWHLAMARGGSAAAVRRVERVLAWERGRAHTITRRTVIGVVLVSAPALLLAAAARPEPARSAHSPVAGLPSLANATTIDLSGVGTRATLAPVPPGHRAAPAPDSAQAPPASPAASPIHLLSADQVPLTAAQVAGHRVWILLFDESSMLAADLQKAVDAATKWADEKMADTDLVALASIGSKLQILQDFTNDRTKIRSGLQKFGAAPVPATPTVTPVAQAELDTFNADLRLRAIKTICDSIRPIQQHKAILYFTAGMSRGADNAIEARAAENACTSSNTSINPVDSRGLQAIVAGGSGRSKSLADVPGVGIAQPAATPADQQATLQPLTSPKAGVGLSLATGQKNCPVTLLSTMSNVTDGAFVNVVVRNDSTRIVRSVIVAAVVRSGMPPASSTAFVMSPALGTWIPPTEQRTLESHVIDMKSLEALRDGSQATLGVVAVLFADGTEWTFDVRAADGFEHAAPPRIPPSPIPGGFGVGAYQPGNGAKNPVPVRHVDPVYTEAARLAKIQGDVEVDAVVLADGTVGDVRVTKPLEPGLDAQAVLAAKQWKFTPAMKDGSPVAMIVGLILEFRVAEKPPAGTPNAPVVGPQTDSAGKTFYFFNYFPKNPEGATPPQPIKRVDPKYTSDAMRAKLQGDVDVEVVVLTDGTVGPVRISKSLDSTFGLDQEALAAARQFLFKPALKDGHPVNYVMTVTLQFRLHGPAPAAGQAYPPGTPGLVAPRVIQSTTPKYSADAMRARIQGNVDMQAVVLADGSVGDVRITKSLDTRLGLDQEALAAMKQWRFRPATLQGQPVDAVIDVTLAFMQHGDPAVLDATSTRANHLVYATDAPGLAPPVVTHWTDPKYTSYAMRAKLQGDIEVEAVVNDDGTVGDVRVTKSLDTATDHYGLDEEAIACAKQWTFTPGRINGRAVTSTVTLVLKFRLH